MGIALPPQDEQLPPQIELALSTMMAQAAQQLLQQNQGQASQQQAQQQAQDPLVQLQMQELQIKQGELQIKQGELQLEQQKVQAEIQFKQQQLAADITAKTDANKLKVAELQANMQLKGTQIGAQIKESQQKQAFEQEHAGIQIGTQIAKDQRDQAIAAQVQNLGQYLIGRNVFEIKHFCQIAFDDYSQRRSSLEFWCAISGIEQAMWDAVGRITRQPVYNLIGGPVRNQIRVYANGWSYKVSDPKEFAKKAKEVIALGFDAIKLDPLPRPWRTYIPKEHIKHAIDVMKAIRNTVGPDVDLLLDIHRRLAPMHAIELANELAEYKPYWFEEPCQAENVEALIEVRAGSPIPTVTGEALYGRADFRKIFRELVSQK
jgi:hypothetical protein